MRASRETVSVVRVGVDLQQSVEEALSLIHWEEQLKGKDLVLVKPNLCDVEYVRGAVTNPEVVSLLVGLLRDRTAEVFVGESDGYWYSADQAFTEVGMRKAVESAGGTVVNLSKDELVEVTSEHALQLKKVKLPKILVEADLLVNVPVMKTHEVTLYTGAIKNLFGCLPSNRRILLHPHLDEVLVDLVQILGDEIVLMDATTGMEGNAPAKGIPVEMNILVAGSDPLSVDHVATRIMCIDKDEIKHLALAEETLGYGGNDFAIVGEPIQNVQRAFTLPYRDLALKAQLVVFKSFVLTYLCFNTPFFYSLKVASKIQRHLWSLIWPSCYKGYRSRF